MSNDRSLAGAGALSAFVTLGAVLLATLVSPTFSWGENALSNLGVTGTSAGTDLTVLLFNGGLIVGGLLGLVFGVELWRRAEGPDGRVVAGLFVLTVVVMGGIGIFPQGTTLHGPLAVAFFVLVTLTLWTDAVVVGGTSEGRRGAVTAWLGATNVLGWLIWAATGPVRREGVAIPEIVGALVFAVWVLSTSMRLSQWDPAPALRR